MGGGLLDQRSLELLLEVGVAVLCGGALGLERELGDKPAGLRTHILICMGAAVFTNLSQQMAGDPGRIAAQIVVGVGFIGGGAIIQRGGSVIGLTTAANIWMVAAIGMVIGLGRLVDGVVITALVLAVLVGLRPLERWIERRHRPPG